MVDNRSAGAFGIGGSFNFKAGDPSGSAAKMSDDKMGQNSEYAFLQKGENEAQYQTPPFVDRSEQLSATLNSLAMANVAGILKNIKKNKKQDENASCLDDADTDDNSDEYDEMSIIANKEYKKITEQEEK